MSNANRNVIVIFPAILVGLVLSSAKMGFWRSDASGTSGPVVSIPTSIIAMFYGGNNGTNVTRWLPQSNDHAKSFNTYFSCGRTTAADSGLEHHAEDKKVAEQNKPNLKRHSTYSPFLTRRFDLALQIASGLHLEQARKGTGIPYIAHLMAVCALVLEAGGDEDQAIAALLHDSVEDQGGLLTLDTIRRLFGDRVATAVEACSDSTVSNLEKKLPWRDRKEKYLEHLRHAGKDALIVAVADKLHNARAVLSDYRQIGEALWSRFSAPKEDQVWFYDAVVKTLRSTTAPSSLVTELDRVVSELIRATEITEAQTTVFMK